jgi:hypothetical protein
MIRTINIPLHNETGRIIHTATIRSDWKDRNYDSLKEMFPHTHFKTNRVKYPINFIGEKYHNTNFNSLYHKELI